MIQSGADEFDKYLDIIYSIKYLHWHKEYKYYYKALQYAIELFRLKESINNVYITSDHGLLYRRGGLNEIHKPPYE